MISVRKEIIALFTTHVTSLINKCAVNRLKNKTIAFR